ncbi:MAG: hypothetical protein ACK2UK_09150 [Candidatus Promineifilaceae bacterium]
MSALRRATIYKLAATAQEAGLEVMTGILRRGSDGVWLVGKRPLSEWLEAHEGEEVSLVLGLLADERPMQVRTCRTCGRDYSDLDCPYCRANRIRLRGHA